ncbi:hypothetical protein Hrd1104_08515 [Halorhabdus sp. CBA1104]|uniref:hypothetical protein n=1 Tax=Halorhabdus sp. CBA1104 TaxID=1380432 RepID=UPI0012B3243A|nr:hypothetical protein [Halorhabdus sp. CBA1104]QGN07343.1 hypothetical protein Hrd1104_08515 [Halorhabdus sp. CBA1104]
MSVSGLCTVCESESAEYTCGRCGSLVCEVHYDPTVGFCVECAGEIGNSRPGDTDQPDDGDTYRF